MTSNCRICAAVVVLMTAGAVADPKTAKDLPRQSAERDCPNMSGLGSICGLVSSRQKLRFLDDGVRVSFENDDGPTVYQYQFAIYRAACVVLKKDDEEAIRLKVQKLWRKFGKELTCDALSFNVSNGSLLKYGVAKRFDDFIEDVVVNWKVDLNQLDQSGETVLDYINKELKNYKGSGIEPTLKDYYKLFRDAGARHKSEL